MNKLENVKMKINYQLQEIERILSLNPNNSYLRGERRGLRKALAIINQENPKYPTLGKTKSEQLALNQKAMNWCRERLSKLRK